MQAADLPAKNMHDMEGRLFNISDAPIATQELERWLCKNAHFEPEDVNRYAGMRVEGKGIRSDSIGHSANPGSSGRIFRENAQGG